MKKQKCLNLGQKMPFFGIFDQKCLVLVFLGKNFKRSIVIFEISTLKFFKNESLTHTVNCSVGSVFSKGTGSAFSEGPGPGSGLGLFYKVYLKRVQ